MANPETVENTEATAEESNDSMLELSDAEFMQMDEPFVGVAKGSEEVLESEDTETNSDESTDESDATDEELSDDTDETTEDSTEEDDTGTDTEEAEDTEEGEESESEENVESDINYKEEYEKILSPFKANGTTIQAKDVNEVISLMQMGANYHKKMAGLKPSLKIVKLLEKNGLLDPDKIGFLIDVNNKNPEAIAKLLKDSEIDPLDLDLDKTEKYKPKTQEVSDGELELDTVLDNIKDTPTYSRTIQVLTEQWDDSSRKVIANNPNIIELINEHMGNGVFDAINSAVVRERSFGKLQGMSDLQAYKEVGDALYNNNQLPGQTPNKTVPKDKTVIAKKKAERTKRKQAVSPTKAKKTPPKETFNPLAMSDEEFEKIAAKNFI